MENCECLDAIFASFDGKRDELIPILQRVREKFGYRSEDATFAVARFTGVPQSSVYAVATFYAQLRFAPPGGDGTGRVPGTLPAVNGYGEHFIRLKETGDGSRHHVHVRT